MRPPNLLFLFTDEQRATNFEHLPTERETLKTQAHWRRMIANYWGLCSLADTHVGTIRRALEAIGCRCAR